MKKIIALSVILIPLLSCAQGDTGIFATLERERKITSNNLVNDASINGLLLAELDNGNHYLAAAGTQLFARAATGNRWSNIGSPRSKQLVQFIAGIDTNNNMVDDEVYAVYVNNDAKQYYLYRLEKNQQWKLAYDPGASRITGLLSSGGRLIASVSNTDGTREIITWASNLTDKRSFSFPSSTRPDDIRDVASNGSVHVFVGLRTNVFMLTDLINGPIQNVSYGGASVLGVGIRPTDNLFALVNRSGEVFLSQDPSGSWQKVKSGLSRAFSDIEWIPNIGENGAFAVGTISDPVFNRGRRGYYHATLKQEDGQYTLDFNNSLGNTYSASRLSVAAIYQFRFFTINNIHELFALTIGRGLWRLSYNNNTTPSIVWE